MMRVLLLQPEDVPERGPWTRQRWDLIVDLGKSSQFSAERWGRQHGCPILRTDSFRHGIADGKKLREIFSFGRGQLVDEEGIDWWELMLPLLTTDGLTALALRAVAQEINPSADLWATRSGGIAAMLAVAMCRTVRNFGESRIVRSFAGAARYAGLLRRFSFSQIKEIFFDKYDPGYEWRSRFADAKRVCGEPVVLLPSAYENVSRMAAAYAQILPEQPFLMVATRQNAKKCVLPTNVYLRDLADYASASNPATEAASLVERWMKVRTDLQSYPELNILLRSGVLDAFPAWIRDGIRVRNAWRGVLDREVIKGVLCGDDSNRYTRLPVLLAARRKIPTVDFHHGAMDGRYVLKELPCDLYLTKNEMERDYMARVCGLPEDRIAVGAPLSAVSRPVAGRRFAERRAIIFFSEPYEVANMRTQEVYREILPPLCRVARESERGLILKLHPFESLSQRRTMVREVLALKDCKIVTVVDGPLTTELLAQTWCGITVESTTVIDCLQNGIRCFLCGWLAHSPFDYVQQYARFGIGEALQNSQQLLEIPRRMSDPRQPSTVKVDLSSTVDPEMLRAWLTKPRDTLGARSLG
jgi:hypothetical protein